MVFEWFFPGPMTSSLDRREKPWSSGATPGAAGAHLGVGLLEGLCQGGLLEAPDGQDRLI